MFLSVRGLCHARPNHCHTVTRLCCVLEAPSIRHPLTDTAQPEAQQLWGTKQEGRSERKHLEGLEVRTRRLKAADNQSESVKPAGPKEACDLGRKGEQALCNQTSLSLDLGSAPWTSPLLSLSLSLPA